MKSEPLLRIDFSELGIFQIVHLLGELDVSNARDFYDTFGQGVCANPSVRAVALDLKELSYVDSTGLSSFLASRNALRSRDIDLFLLYPNAFIYRLFEVTGLAGEFRILREADAEPWATEARTVPVTILPPQHPRQRHLVLLAPEDDSST